MTTAPTTQTTKKPTQKTLHVKGTLEKIFPTSKEAKILDFLITFQENDYSKNDISKHSNVSFRHTLKAIQHLETTGLIKHTRNVSHAHMYKYNTDSQAAKILNNFTVKYPFEQHRQKIADQLTGNEETTVL